MLSHSLTGTVTATLALAAFAIGCSQQPVASTDEQFIGEAKCSAEEYEPLVACAAEPCDGLAGDPLSECIANNCDESVFEVRESCAACIVHNLSGIDDIVRACGAAPPPSTACLDTEMAPLVECAAQPCVGLAGDPLMACISDSCPSSVFEVTESCAHCILSNQSSIGAMASACTAETKPATACSADEVDPIVSCAAESWSASSITTS